MELRPALLPPAIDKGVIRRLAKLAARLDGALPGQSKADITEFNRVAGTTLRFEDFQDVYSAEDHATWVRRFLTRQLIRPVADVTPAELAEVVRRAMPQNGYAEHDSYMAVFDANVPHPGASNLIYYPMDYDPATNTWDGGRPISEYDPSPAQIVVWALNTGRTKPSA